MQEVLKRSAWERDNASKLSPESGPSFPPSFLVSPSFLCAFVALKLLGMCLPLDPHGFGGGGFRGLWAMRTGEDEGAMQHGNRLMWVLRCTWVDFPALPLSTPAADLCRRRERALVHVVRMAIGRAFDGSSTHFHESTPLSDFLLHIASRHGLLNVCR